MGDVAPKPGTPVRYIGTTLPYMTGKVGTLEVYHPDTGRARCMITFDDPDHALWCRPQSLEVVVD